MRLDAELGHGNWSFASRSRRADPLDHYSPLPKWKNVYEPTLGVTSHQASEEHLELLLDEALEESFPASDPVAAEHSDHTGAPPDHESSDRGSRKQAITAIKEPSMSLDPRLVLTSFEDGRAIVEVHYGDRHARLELDLLEDRYAGQPTEERVQEEVARLVEALNIWFEPPVGRIESA